MSKKIEKGPERINPELVAVPIGALRTDPGNTRRHDRRSIEAIKASLDKFGQHKPVIVRKDGTVLAGNGTLTAAQELGWKRIGRTVFDGSETEALALAIADNRSAELSTWDEDALAKALESLNQQTAGFDPTKLGFEETEFLKLLSRLAPPDLAPAPAGDVAPLGQLEDGITTQPSPDDITTVRVVQVFLQQAQQADFQAKLVALAKHFGTDSVSDTIIRVVNEAHAGLPVASTSVPAEEPLA
jgi:ParB-like chromosome segregation protein Spo0J